LRMLSLGENISIGPTSPTACGGNGKLLAGGVSGDQRHRRRRKRRQLNKEHPRGRRCGGVHPITEKSRDGQHHSMEGRPVATSQYDPDLDALISRLAGPLLPADRQAFREAALDALTRVPCWGEGAVYRAVATLQRQYFHPPAETNHPLGVGSRRPSKLASAAPIGAPDPREDARLRRRFRAV